ncbi:toxin-antitoxin system YwqK family antitoxin [Entomomonas sp. E2T0]|uniref:toxin-antitoxin system YwqK family antitoxin n=1 Tax=Entomomonas sp. E2T0 TaxID=2930213 RepID=UPI0022284328|nr:toxin-antitoxin system YwqK family antitoxin [Entomomonas sp. E2T0]UYZ82680.1 toxin-antitoxin system YwqK family antitoxin [Entomomonas sp. E2T0]
MKTYPRILSTLCLIGLISHSPLWAETTTTNSEQVPIISKNLTENTIIVYFNLYDETVADKESSETYRKLLKVNNDGSYLVQDFYSKTDNQLTSPMTLKKAQDLTVNYLHLKDLDGTILYSNEDGSKMLEKTFKNGKVEGTLTRWNKAGQKNYEAHYKDNKLEGVVYSWHDNGKKASESHFKNGKLDGKTINWNELGNKKQEANYKAGKQDGVTTHWYEGKNQKLYETHYKDGNRDGLHTTWYENGQKKSEENYKNDMLDGLSTSWDENGHKEYEINYKEDRPLDSTR